MTDFTMLPIDQGYGEIHMNRFRIYLKARIKPPATPLAAPTGGLTPVYNPRLGTGPTKPTLQSTSTQVLGPGDGQIAANLLLNMPNYMDKRSASVEIDKNKSWHKYDTLKFTGVIGVRDLSNALVKDLGISPEKKKIIDKLRDWAIPDVHNDYVGIAQKDVNGFTGQTLKREFRDNIDDAIAIFLGSAGSSIAKLLIELNQHHFLAGRRSFRFFHGDRLGFGDGRLVFETAAVERYSLKIFAKSEMVTGSFRKIIRTLWVQMVENFANYHSYTAIQEPATLGWEKSGAVHYMEADVDAKADAVHNNPQWKKDMNVLHPALFEWGKRE